MSPPACTSAKPWAWAKVVPRKGLEPSRPLSHWHLKPARLPIPPPGPGRVSKDRSRACQIASMRPNPLYSGIALAYRESAKRHRYLSNLTGRNRPMTSRQETLVTVFGGSGFLGRHVVRALARRDYRIRVAVRRPELAGHLQPIGRVGQIHAVQANVRYPASVEAAMRGSSVAVNLIGILAEGGAQSFDAVQARGAETIARRRPLPARAWSMYRRSAPTRIRPPPMPARRHPAKRPCWPPCRRPPSCARRWCSARRISSPIALPRWRGYRRFCR